MKTIKRVPNYKISQLLKERIPFENYNKSIIATIDKETNTYFVIHWATLILSYDTKNEAINSFDFSYYSQTTSTLQGKIVRSVFSPSQIADLLDLYKREPETKKLATRLKRIVMSMI